MHFKKNSEEYNLRSKVIKKSVFSIDQIELKYTQDGLDLHQLNVLFNIFQGVA